MLYMSSKGIFMGAQVLFSVAEERKVQEALASLLLFEVLGDELMGG